jgi:hypothetical protein
VTPALTPAVYSWVTLPSAYAVALTTSSRCGSDRPCSSGSPWPSATGWTVRRYSLISRAPASAWVKRAPPKQMMSLPGWRLSAGISSSIAPRDRLALLYSTSGSVAEHTIFAACS